MERFKRIKGIKTDAKFIDRFISIPKPNLAVMTDFRDWYKMCFDEAKHTKDATFIKYYGDIVGKLDNRLGELKAKKSMRIKGAFQTAALALKQGRKNKRMIKMDVLQGAMEGLDESRYALSLSRRMRHETDAMNRLINSNIDATSLNDILKGRERIARIEAIARTIKTEEGEQVADKCKELLIQVDDALNIRGLGKYTR